MTTAAKHSLLLVLSFIFLFSAVSPCGEENPLAPLLDKGRELALTVLSRSPYDAEAFPNLVREALARDGVSPRQTAEALGELSRSWAEAEALLNTRESLFARYQDEARRGDVRPGTRLGWSLIRVGAAGPDVHIGPDDFAFDDAGAELSLSYKGMDVTLTLSEDDYRECFRGTAGGYAFRTGWVILAQKPVAWMTAMAAAMQAAGVLPDAAEAWDVMEAPGGLIALGSSGDSDVPEIAFFQDNVHPVTPLPVAGRPEEPVSAFFAAAEALTDGVMNDASIPQPLRAALRPVLEGTYKPIDPRDYFDADFCRRLIEAEYLETQVPRLSAERRAELAAYRAALAAVERGQDAFAIDLGEDGRLVAVLRQEMDADAAAAAAYRDKETGESVSRYLWRWEQADATLFHAPLPSRYLYAMSVLTRYAGAHTAPPAATPAGTEVWHATLGRLASYRSGAARADGDAALWLAAVTLDARGGRDTTSGPLGWNFPLFVPVTDGQGDPVLLATAQGVVESPDFSAVSGAEERRLAEETWLDGAAATLATPGELALLYQLFFRYCSDSPLPERPNLIGSHYGLSDTHQTVRQSLERRWAGRLIGDCDDVAEFFQNLCARQGRLSHVMQLPAHAAAGYLADAPEGGYEFVVLQTGPVLRFVTDSREGAVEQAYRHFDAAGDSGVTAEAVPLLLRFADEETRTAFVLPARIYWDRDYADKMIAVQGYWHVHAFTSAIKAMEEILETDRSPGNLRELSSLYERVGDYSESARLRHEEYEAVADDAVAALAVLADLAQLSIKDNNPAEALAYLTVMEDTFREWRSADTALYADTAAFRHAWAGLITKAGEPGRAARLLRHDVRLEEERGGPLPEALLRTLVGVHSRLMLQRDSGLPEELTLSRARLRHWLQTVLAKAFGQGYFQAGDANNKISSRYFWLGRYAVAAAGRRNGLDMLWRDGPYPAAPRDHAARERDITDADWAWLRINPALYLALAAEMLDPVETPELLDPEAARRSLECVARAGEQGAAFGADVAGRGAMMQAELLLAFIRNDLAAFRGVMRRVRERDYASLYNDAALTFGMYCGLAPEADFAAWLAAFHEFFPGRQHYFMAAYLAFDRREYAHAVMLARATAGYFPADALLVEEAAGLEKAVERRRAAERQGEDWLQSKPLPIRNPLSACDDEPSAVLLSGLTGFSSACVLY